MKLISVNVGRPRDNPAKGGTTWIHKQPVSHPVAVTAPGPKGTGAVGLAGDRVGDVRHHGGDDQAVYAYAREDLDHFETMLSRKLPDGMFGENLTTTGLDVTAARIGERWRIGTVLLQVTAPRIPCGTFRFWIAEQGWLKTFTNTERPGAYLRVIEPGELRAGDTITIEHRPDHDVTVAYVFRAHLTDHSLRPGMLAAGNALPASEQRIAREHTQ